MAIRRCSISGWRSFATTPVRLSGAPDTPTEVLVETTPGVIMGTFKYMSPEQARGREVDGRSDLFSLGVTLYEMLSGQVPFGGDTAADVIARLIHDDPAAVSTMGPAPRAFDPIVARLLRKLPEHRYQSADDLASDLRAVARHVEGARESVRSPDSGEQPALRAPRIRPHPEYDQATNEAQRGFGRGSAARKSQPGRESRLSH